MVTLILLVILIIALISYALYANSYTRYLILDTIFPNSMQAVARRYNKKVKADAAKARNAIDVKAALAAKAQNAIDVKDALAAKAQNAIDGKAAARRAAHAAQAASAPAAPAAPAANIFKPIYSGVYALATIRDDLGPPIFGIEKGQDILDKVDTSTTTYVVIEYINYRKALRVWHKNTLPPSSLQPISFGVITNNYGLRYPGVPGYGVFYKVVK